MSHDDAYDPDLAKALVHDSAELAYPVLRTIIEEGTHAGLMEQGGHYAELYDTYFRHQAMTYIESFGRKEPALQISS